MLLVLSCSRGLRRTLHVLLDCLTARRAQDTQNTLTQLVLIDTYVIVLPRFPSSPLTPLAPLKSAQSLA